MELLALVGLVVAGRTLSDKGCAPGPKRIGTVPGTRHTDFFDDSPLSGAVNEGNWTNKREIPTMFAPTRDGGRRPQGEPNYDFTSRQPITNRMNNVGPVERRVIGPGVGVGPDVVSAGGFQSFFRALPANPNEERLNTLEGTTGGPGGSSVSMGPVPLGAVSVRENHDKTFFRAPLQTSAQGQGGPITGQALRGIFVKSSTNTGRSQVGEIRDGSNFGTPFYGVPAPYGEVLPLNRSSGFRCTADRTGNPGNMNVRGDPINQVGAATNLRGEFGSLPPGAPSAAYAQNYTTPRYNDNLKTKRVSANTRSNLDIAILQLEGNETALPPLSA
jgi:hypothetical protein